MDFYVFTYTPAHQKGLLGVKESIVLDECTAESRDAVVEGVHVPRISGSKVYIIEKEIVMIVGNKTITEVLQSGTSAASENST